MQPLAVAVQHEQARPVLSSPIARCLLLFLLLLLPCTGRPR